jgi:hypothetical protein
VAGLAALTFARTLGGSFIWDDHLHIVGNARLVGLAGLAEIWTSLDQPDYWPVSWSALWVLRQTAGLTAWPYHLAQVLVHALAAALAGWALVQMRWRGAWLAAALWAVHPLQAQVVAWPFQLKTTLAAAFFFASMGWWARWLRQGGRAALAASLLCGVLAMLSKTQAVMLPVVWGGMWAWMGWSEGRGGEGASEGPARLAGSRRHLAASGAAVAALGVLAGLLGGVTMLLQQRQPTIDATLNMDSLGRTAAAGHAMLFYLRQAVWPAQLAAVYPRWTFDPQSWSSLWAMAAVLAVLVGLAVAAWRRGGRWAAVFAGVLFFLVNLGPVLGWVDFQFMTLAPVADHFASIALLGLAGAAGAALVGERGDPDATRGGKAGPGAAWCVAVLMVGACVALSVQRAGVFRDDQTLWQDNIARQPGVWVGYHNLALVRQGQERWAEAMTLSEQACQRRPDRPDAQLTRGEAAMKLGRYDEALSAFESARSLLPDWPLAWLRVGEARQARGEVEAAAQAYREALRLRPVWPAADQRLSELLGLH